MSEVKTDSVVNVSGDSDSGIDLSTNDVVAIKTADSERVRVASDGKVGIGDTTPDDTLSIYGGTQHLRVGNSDSNHVRIGRNTTSGNFEMMRTTTGATDQVFFKAVEADDGNVILQEGGGYVGIGEPAPVTPLTIATTNKLGSTFTGTTNGEGVTVSQTGYTAGNYVSLIEAPYIDTQDGKPAVRIGAMFDGGGSNLAFGTTNNFANGITNTALFIDSSGHVLVGTTSTTPNPGVSLQKEGNIGIGNSNGTNGVSFTEYRRNATQIGSVTQNGTTGVNFNTSSDHRLKENVVDMSGAITRVKQLLPKRFEWISDEDDRTVDGFLAHEAQTVVPEAVTGTHNEVDDDGNPVMQGIDQSKLVPLLTGALQEAIAKIETLETEMTALKARVTALEA